MRLLDTDLADKPVRYERKPHIAGGDPVSTEDSGIGSRWAAENFRENSQFFWNFLKTRVRFEPWTSRMLELVPQQSILPDTVIWKLPKYKNSGVRSRRRRSYHLFAES